MQEGVDGKSVYAPTALNIGDNMKMTLVHNGSYFEATLVDQATEFQPRKLE